MKSLFKKLYICDAFANLLVLYITIEFNAEILFFVIIGFQFDDAKKIALIKEIRSVVPGLNLVQAKKVPCCIYLEKFQIFWTKVVYSMQ